MQCIALLCCAVLFEAAIIDSHIAWSGGGETGWRRDGKERSCSIDMRSDDGGRDLWSKVR